ncbi:MAG: DUF6364 family protein [Anaerolineae bacterium]|jgi:hypothetical protein|nr:DUF6364 family protein [Anaerolineae bacterium]
MEETKLTVRVPKRTLTVAKQYARRHDTTLTRLITGYLQKIERAEVEEAEGLSPVVQRLRGSLSDNVSEDDYRRYLEEKYLG